MFFAELQESLLLNLRAKVRNGELTERSLARVVGVSQPHMHNVLNGRRTLTPGLGDQILQRLRLSLWDLVDSSDLRRHCSIDTAPLCYLPVLSGKIGPTQPWPGRPQAYERFPVPANVVRRMWHPVVCYVSDDVRMLPLFSDGDMVLLDQSYRARTQIDREAFYVIKRGRVGLIRRIRTEGRQFFAVAEDSVDRKANWELLSTDGIHLAHVVRAKALFIGRENNWDHRKTA